MPDADSCKQKCLDAFDRARSKTPLSDEARAWLERWCEEWVRSQGLERWEEHGEAFTSRFASIAAQAAQRAREAGVASIETATLKQAAGSVIRTSSSPYCPPEPDGGG